LYIAIGVWAQPSAAENCGVTRGLQVENVLVSAILQIPVESSARTVMVCGPKVKFDTSITIGALIVSPLLTGTDMSFPYPRSASIKYSNIPKVQ